MIDIFIPSYHRPNNIKTVKYFIKKGYDPKKLHVFIDDETDDIEDYKKETKKFGCNLHIFDMKESRARWNYTHRPSKTRRSAGQARNMFYDFAKKLDINFYIAIDDDTSTYEMKPYGVYKRVANLDEINKVFEGVREMMQRRRIGLFGLSQTGDSFTVPNTKVLRHKVMNTTFVDTRFIYRGERGKTDDDTSQFVGVMNEGYFTGSLASGLVLQQTPSAKAKGGLTDIYNESKLLSKSLEVPIQFPSLCYAQRQRMIKKQ